ncbi:GNAT family N-acetyltransferase [Actinopolymorpha pittospori]|uniref:Ribosomal-protein-alanine N-acetyltransferase n=1 Tax=Actinopolymorpha pittospori TaxID=648752 RepID=A0A927MQI0_9ACTN|nr:GNAT family protein [Actinopolymorpha pittospori]MBE1605031.1 ribosomal-protein-alanine N-acetyltransferase [Actinopolymorpha pittospori]
MLDSIALKPATPDHAEAVTAALIRNRDHMRRWDPDRPASFFTPEAQAERLANPDVHRWHLVDGDLIVGEATLSNLVRGALSSVDLGYWVDAAYTGRGLATRLAEESCRAARDDLGLHRVGASTLVDNVVSQRVLHKCGFEQIGTAPRYLHINGEWRDNHLFQRILYDGPHQRAS